MTTNSFEYSEALEERTFRTCCLALLSSEPPFSHGLPGPENGDSGGAYWYIPGWIVFLGTIFDLTLTSAKVVRTVRIRSD